MAHVVSLDVDDNVEVALNGFFVATDDPCVSYYTCASCSPSTS